MACITVSADTTYEGQLSDWIVLWSTTLNGTMHTVTDLDINPTEDSHVYKLVVTGQDAEVDEVLFPNVFISELWSYWHINCCKCSLLICQ